jgi:hypothetical protein
VINEVLLGAVDNGNGAVVGIGSTIRNAVSNPVRFEPVIAPLTKRRGLDDTRPKFTLRVDGQVYVFGIDDVFAHEKRDHIRRANNAERYGSPDYLMLLKVALLQMFATHRGKDPIKPGLILTIPIDQYNDPGLAKKYRTQASLKRRTFTSEFTRRERCTCGSVTCRR